MLALKLTLGIKTYMGKKKNLKKSECVISGHICAIYLCGYICDIYVYICDIYVDYK